MTVFHGRLDSYRNLCVEFYDLDKAKPPETGWAFYLGYAERGDGPILEPMCGSGRYLIPLLERGFDIDGVDASPEMIEVCRRHCATMGLSAMLYQQLLHEMELHRQYALVIIPAGSFGLIIDDEEARRSLENICKTMLPGARMVLEIETPKAKPDVFGQWFGTWIERPDGAKIVMSTLNGLYDEERNILYSINKYELMKDGKLLETEWETFNRRFYEPETFMALLNQAGFTEIKYYKAWHEYADRKPDEGDPSVAFECCCSM